jgi:hypothetical protein
MTKAKFGLSIEIQQTGGPHLDASIFDDPLIRECDSELSYVQFVDLRTFHRAKFKSKENFEKAVLKYWNGKRKGE